MLTQKSLIIFCYKKFDRFYFFKFCVWIYKLSVFNREIGRYFNKKYMNTIINFDCTMKNHVEKKWVIEYTNDKIIVWPIY